MSTESARSAVEPARRAAPSSTTNMAALIQSTISRTRRWVWDVTATAWQQSVIGPGADRDPTGYSARTRWTIWTAAEPSPTAAATRFMLPARTAPTENTLGRLVS